MSDEGHRLTGEIWASLPVPALLLDAEDRIDALNPEAEAFLNASLRSLKGRSVHDCLIVDAPIEGALTRVRLNRSPVFINDSDVGTHERASVACNLQIAPLTDHPEILLVVIAPRQIAGRLGRAPGAAARSAIGMAEMLAHEIKNPLAGISGAAQLLSMSLEGEDLELTDLIVAETRRVVQLLEQVEQFGNLRPPLTKPVNLHDLLDRARRSASVGFAAHMQIHDDYDPSLPPTLADGDQLLQVFLNLLKNAAEAVQRSGQGTGTIRLRTFYEPSLRVRGADGVALAVPLQVEIVDDGPGLPPEIADEIFEPFISGRENGTGLGLALVSKIVIEHRGWISVESAPGRTAFRISLPVAPEGGAPDANQET
ncbi:nitrogen regulation protein NR(II) [Tropicimonas sp. IMCC34011]|uniref:two-component system sensor histidine kinase NtrB n=1 Tax=Tropicimonas sp. IMCC34011 TaxID=2248759 RepID=UPI000E269B26|nr:ATP-binding protein [Tropicimonas sp. IMCC34011]